MAIQISGTTVIDNSRQLQNIASLDATTEATIGAVAGTSTTFGDVGTYAWATTRSISGGSYFTAGSTYAGSGLYPAGTSMGSVGYSNSDGLFYRSSTNSFYVAPYGGSALSGTWRAMGSTSSYQYSSDGAVTLFVRIS